MSDDKTASPAEGACAVSDERRKEAEEYADGIGANVSRAGNVVLAHLAGDEAGARRVRDAEREAILRFIRDNGMWWTWGTILAAIERGEHRGGK